MCFQTGNILARWNHTLTNGSDTSLQVYFDRYHRVDVGSPDVLNTFDIDFQHHVALGKRHDIVWGAGYRVTADHEFTGYARTYLPLSRTINLFSGFIQDEIALGSSVSFTLGSKFEHNFYTGFEYEPSAKLLWQPTARQAVWFSAARAIVQTSRIESSIKVDLSTFPTAGGGFGVVHLLGNPNADVERLYDFEAGYRVQVNPRLSLDFATFVSSYSGIGGAVAGTTYFATDQGPPHVVLPLIFEYVAGAHSQGIEAFGTWTVSRRWKITPSVSGIHLAANNFYVTEDANNTPQIQTQIRSSLELTKHVNWDAAFWHIGRLRDGGDGAVPAYNRVDTRFAWQVGESAEFSVVGQNLLTPRHAEFHNAYDVHRSLIERSVFAQIAWRF